MNFFQKCKDYHQGHALFAFQIFLLVLIIIGILLIATRNAWIPSVVGYILSNDEEYQNTFRHQRESVEIRNTFNPLMQETTNEDTDSTATKTDTNVLSENTKVSEFEPFSITNGTLYYRGDIDKPFEQVATVDEGFDPNTFSLVDLFNEEHGYRTDSNFGKDKNNVYYGSSILEELDPATFLVGIGFIKDALHVFYDESGLPDLFTHIPNADPDSFEFVGYCAGYEIDTYTYYRDKYRVYINAEQKPYINAASFQYLGTFQKNDKHFGLETAFAKDKNFVYKNCGEIIEGADPLTFSP